jgi:hypothetical protein
MPITFPFPVRVSVGLVLTGVEHLRTLPSDLPTLGVSAAGQAMRWSMRLQQEFATLAVRGDEVLSRIGGGPPERPAWATFDEEEPDRDGDVVSVVAVIDDGAVVGVLMGDEDLAAEDDAESDGYPGEPLQELAEVIALDLVASARSRGAGAEAEAISDADGAAPEGDPGPVAESGAADDVDYDSLTLAQLRGTLRRLSADDVTELLDRERSGADRPAFVTLLTNRLTSLEQGHP